MRALADEVGRYHELYGESVLVVDARGTPSVHAGSDMADPDIVAAVAAARRNQRPHAAERLTPWGAPRMLIARPVGTGVQVNGAVVIETSTAHARADIARAWSVIAVGAVFAMVLFTLLALSRWVLRPLAALSHAVAELTETLPQPRGADRGVPMDAARQESSESDFAAAHSAWSHSASESSSARAGEASEHAHASRGATALRSAWQRILSTGADAVRMPAASWRFGAKRRAAVGGAASVTAVKRRAPGSIARRYGGPPEMRAVAESFDVMALAVADSAEAQRQLVADTAHAMRNPLAALTIRLDSLEPAIPDSAAATFRSASAEVDRLTALLDGLLTLAVAEAPTDFDADERSVVDYDNQCDALPVVADRVDAWHFAYENAGIGLRTTSTSATADTAVSADVLAQILDVPLSNSCRYAGFGARTVVTVAAEPGWVTVTVHADGIGAPADEIGKLTTRFFRGSAAPAGGSGLGLPIAAALTHASGGTFTVESVHPQGLSVYIRLPAAVVQ